MNKIIEIIKVTVMKPIARMKLLNIVIENGVRKSDTYATKRL